MTAERLFGSRRPTDDDAAPAESTGSLESSTSSEPQASLDSPDSSTSPDSSDSSTSPDSSDSSTSLNTSGPLASSHPADTEPAPAPQAPDDAEAGGDQDSLEDRTSVTVRPAAATVDSASTEPVPISSSRLFGSRSPNGGDAGPYESEDGLVVTITPDPGTEPRDLGSRAETTPAATATALDADALTRTSACTWGTPAIALAAAGEGRGATGDDNGSNGAGTAVAVARVSDDDTAEIRRWDDSETDVMHAVGRRPEPLPERDQVEVTAQRPEPSSGGRWYEVPLMLLLAFTLAFLLRTFVVQVFYVPSVSMVPTLEVNDRIATEKVTYRFRDLARGDVIVFAGDEPFGAGVDMSTGQRVVTGVGQFLGIVPVDAEDFVKRVIGLPGDTIEIVDGVVSVNGVQLDEPYAILDSSNGAWEVPAGSLFVMGDNRPNSGDSRTSLGYIDEDDVVGRAVAKIWPLDRIGAVEGVDWEPIPDPS